MFTRLAKLLKHDKLLHYVISQVLFLALFLGIRAFFGWEYIFIVLVAAGLALAIGVLKEVYDHLSGNGDPEVSDIVANVLGIAILVFAFLA